MKEILVHCLTRYGDLIQATPLLRSLRREHPDARITLAAQKGFSAILPLMRNFDRTLIFDQDEAARVITLAEDPLAPYRHMESFVRLLERDSYDMAVNLSCSRLSAYMVSTMNAGRINGITALESGQRVINNPWSLYLFTLLFGSTRRLNRINLVDIFTRIGDAPPDGQPVELFETTAGSRFAEAFLARHGAAGEKLVGLQLGASDAVRCWPAENFARLSDLLQQQGMRTVLFGVPKERELAERARGLMRIPPIDAVGETDIEGLFSLLKRCALLVTNDTGTMHFAAAGGIPSVMLCIGPAFFQCTGPYSAGNIALQPALACSPCKYNLKCLKPDCLKAITVDSVHNAVLLALGRQHDPSAFATVRVFRSGFAPDGYLNWDGLHNVDAAEEAVALGYAGMWKRCLDGNFQAWVDGRTGLAADFQRRMERGLELCARLQACAGEFPLPMERVRELGEEESALEAEIRLLGNRRPELAPLVDFVTLLRENMSGEGLEQVAAETRRVYETGRALAANL